MRVISISSYRYWYSDFADSKNTLKFLNLVSLAFYSHRRIFISHIQNEINWKRL